MRTLLAKIGILSTAVHSSRVLPRDEGRIWTTPQDSVNGSFNFPRTYPLTLREGSSINISWSMTYENINLYFYQRGKVATSVQLVTNWATEWYQWEVHAEETNLTNPFVFRIVNAQGTAEEQNGGGFWSTSWFLSRDDKASTSQLPLSSVVSSITVASSTTSSSPATSSSSVTSSLSATSSQVPISTAQETSPEATVVPSAETQTHHKGLGQGIIIGLAVGLVAALVTIIAGVWYCLRKHKQKKNTSVLGSASTVIYYDKTHSPKEMGYGTTHEVFAQPPELNSAPPCYELPGTK
ncbi:hypothetical protein OPT61_g4026 [Boeremia exigua]|uniref:Uncharacterized protein n=1 Tax=Boeremia exigua TaxID=749465 RepID=A0ACC2IFP4_9PLEO|nr:hypothetical protein OPT61_g4026 [Boeremia exigua]